MGAFYRSKHELVAVFKIGKAPHTNTFGLGDKGRYRTNVWSYAGVNSFSADRMDQLTRHPTSKPVALVADAIRDDVPSRRHCSRHVWRVWDHPYRRAFHGAYCQVGRTRPGLLRCHSPALAKLHRKGSDVAGAEKLSRPSRPIAKQRSSRNDYSTRP